MEKLKPLKEELENQRYQLVGLPGEMSRTLDELEKAEEAQAGGKH